MSWFNTLLDVTNLAMNVSNYAQLQEMRAQGAAATLIQTLLRAMRDQIFRFKQAAEDILSDDTRSLKIKAGALSWLEVQLRESQITADIFPDLSDKDYVASTIRFIRSNTRALLNQLSTEEQAEVNQFLSAAKDYEDYSYYLDNYEKEETFQRAKEEREDLGWRNSGLTKAGLVIVLFFIYGMLVNLFWDAGATGWWIIILGILASGFLINRWQGAQRYKRALATIRELDDEINHRLIEKIGDQVESDHKTPFESKYAAKTIVDNFLAGNSVLSYRPPQLPESQNDESPMADILTLEKPAPKSEQMPSVSLNYAEKPQEISMPVVPSPRKETFQAEPVSNQVSFCSRCGTKYPPTAQFCPKCGNPITNN
ncbi:MAG TPA: zinc-ribbon domain-containing protein [Anaerolineales bacterium]|nr:zinc-ribbon domain-containing protein [Anaerolineales bacterium]